MNAEDFRKLALALPDTQEHAHMEHPDFRVGGKIFATLGYPDDAWAMVKLFPGQQRDLLARHPGVFIPATGAWGRTGCTCVFLEGAAKAVVAEALRAAWRRTAVRSTILKLEKEEGVEPRVRRSARSKAKL